MWTKERALTVYRAVFPNDPVGKNDPRADAIAEEMNAVKFAATPEEGAKAIEWWGWYDEFPALDAARKIRRYRA